jgi:DNA gyrase subunit A
VRARTVLEEHQNKTAIIITELPYQVNKARLLEKIAELVREKKIDGITALRDESDKDGMRMVIELRRGEMPEVVLNNLYTQTAMESVFGINMVALDGGQPLTLNLKQILEAFLRHRREVVTRRTLFDLRKTKARAHLLEGLSIALANVDEIIRLIKASKNPEIAKEQLLSRRWQPGQVTAFLERVKGADIRPENLSPDYGLSTAGYRLSPEQVQAILDLRLHRLTGLEQEKIFEEYQQLLDFIHELMAILQSEQKLMQIIRQELLEIKAQFNDERRTEIAISQQDLTTEDLIAEEDRVVTLSHEGYAKTQSLDVYQAQRRGGKGKAATSMKEEDFIERLVIANTHDTILCFSNLGKVYWLKVYQLPQAARNSRGRPIINLLPLAEGERIQAFLPVKEFKKDSHVFMATSKGVVKKVSLEQFSRPRTSGIIALELQDDDRLIGVALTDGLRDVMLFSNTGKVVRFSEKKVRAMGRTARGVRGMKLLKDQAVIALIIAEKEGAILTATENGYGKRTEISEYRTIGRGGQGVISIQVSERNGKVVVAEQVLPTDEVMLITDQGTLVRTRAKEISMVGRNTQGVRLIHLSSGEKLKAIARIADIKEEMLPES